VVESPAALLALGASIAFVVAQDHGDPDEALDAIEDAIDPLSNAQIDNMGRDYIVYWPSITA
jgi:hypothetical protein